MLRNIRIHGELSSGHRLQPASLESPARLGDYGLGRRVIDNTGDGVAPTPCDDAADAYGIRTIDNGAGSVNDNRIRGLAPISGHGPAYGI